MSVTSTSSFSTATGNGAATSFPFTFAVRNEQDVAVYVNGVLQLAGFSAALSADFNSGTVTFTTPPATGAAIRFQPEPSFVQPVDFENAGAYNPRTIDGALDDAAIRDIALKRDTDRALKAPLGESIADLPPLASRAGKFAAYDQFGNPTAEALVITTADGASVASRALLAATANPVAKQSATLTEPGYEGGFVFDNSNLSTQIAADPQRINYIAPSSDTTGASGAWVRKPDLSASAPTDGPPNSSMFWWTTNPVSLNGKVYVSTTRAQNDVWLDVYSKAAAGGPAWHRSYFLGHVGNTTAQDDHHAGGVALRAGKPLLVFFSGHAYSNIVYYVSTLKNIDAYLPGEPLTFGSVKQFELPPGNTTAYAIVLLRSADDTIRLLHRTGDSANFWSISSFPSWGAGTPTTKQVFSSADQFYVTGRMVGDVARCIISDHPSIGTDNKVWYAEVNFATGAITKSDGTVLGNLDGTNLPLAEATCELIYTSPGTQKPWTFDVGYGANPQIAFVTGQNPPNFATTANYMYAEKVAGAWVINPITAVGSFLGGSYFPSITFDPMAASAVYLAHEAGGVTSIERHETTDHGATWTTAVLESAVVATDTTLSRVFPVQQLDAVTPPFSVLATQIDSYPTYNGAWVMRVTPLPRAQLVKRLADIIPTDSSNPSATGLYLPGTSGSYVSAPNATLGSLVNGIRFEVDVALDNWASGAVQNLLAKEQSSTARSFRMIVNSDGKIGLFYSLDGTTTSLIQTGVATGFANGQRAEVAAILIPQFNSTQYKARFLVRAHGQDQWTELGTTQLVGTVGTIADNSSPFEIGSRWLGTTELAAGVFYRASVKSAGGATTIAEWRGDMEGPTAKGAYGNLWTRWGDLGASPALTSAYNGTRPLKLGVYTEFYGSDGVRRYKATAPADGTDGFPLHTIRGRSTYTASGTLLTRDDWAVLNATGSITMTLPSTASMSAVGDPAKQFEVSCISASGAVLAPNSGQTINGSTATVALTQWQTARVKYLGGGAWFVTKLS